jgi:hypothetical protein
LRRQRRSSRGAYVKLASACSESSAFKCPVARLARTQTQAQILALSYASSPPGANNGRGTRGELKGCRANRLGLVRTALAARAAKTLSVGQLRLCAERPGGDTLGATLEVRPLALCAPAPSTQRRCVAIARPNQNLALTAWFLHVCSSASLHSAQNRKIHGPCLLACAPTRARLLSLWCAPASPARGVAVSHPRPNV